ncbi:uncharacterized protein LOC131073363 isoform X2 [Cryptomeria japonica]|uniref:uncharacterized protein LOC131073363 isoform X2 n=1 Tax=Cryptomeria japonica TaxID=3369 RepID=UPI0027DA5DA4|nr:uncharacterized protein LOC131073363 isoform X2 [Cryptomeria japonica]
MAECWATRMAKYWATCAAGLEFTVCKELKGLEGTGVISNSLFSGGVLFETMCPAELLSLRAVDNIYAFVAHFQDLPMEKDAAISFLKGLAVKVDWSNAFYIFRSWNRDGVKYSLPRPSLDGDGSISFRVSCDRTCTEMKRHEFTSVDAEAAIGEGIHYLFGWPASMRMYDLEVVTWIVDAEVLMSIALLPNWNRRMLEAIDVCNHKHNSAVPDLLAPPFETKASSEMGERNLRSRPSRTDSQLYARRLYRKALVETSLKPSTAFSLLQLGEVQPGHLILDPIVISGILQWRNICIHRGCLETILHPCLEFFPLLRGSLGGCGVASSMTLIVEDYSFLALDIFILVGIQAAFPFQRMCGCGTIPLEAAAYFSGQVMCLGGDTSSKAIAAAESNSREIKELCDVLHWDATRLPLRSGCVDRIICDMPFGVRCGSTRVRQWLCPKVLREMIRVLAPNTGLVVLMVQGRFMRKEVEINQNQFLRLLKHLDVQMEGIRVEVFVMQRTSEPAPEHGSSCNTKSLTKKNIKRRGK